MPVLLAALLVLGLLAAVALKQASRRKEARARSKGRLTERLDDPREAAAILLVQQAAYDGHVSTEQKQTITALMIGNFGVDTAAADDLYAFGRMAVDQIGDAAASIRRITVPILNACTLSEMDDLAGMLAQVGETGGPMSDRQRLLVAETRRTLKLPPLD